MVGMIQILTYLLCIYLVFKAFEIFQIALMSAREKRTLGLIIGSILICASIAIGLAFAYWIDKQAISLSL